MVPYLAFKPPARTLVAADLDTMTDTPYIRTGLIAAWAACATLAGATVLVSEFQAINAGGLLDEDGASSDWIELHNGGSAPVDLAGWRLTDNPALPNKWVLPAHSLGAGEYLLVFASGKNRTNPLAELHANFKLDGDGEYLGLLRPDGTLANDFGTGYPEQRSDFSYGLLGGLGVSNRFFFATPTPGAANSPGFIAFVGDTKFSVDRGFYTQAFTVAITTDTPGATIRYTTDGTAPTPSSWHSLVV
jgi:hypothetical protein